MLDLRTMNDVMVKVTGRGEKTVMLWQDAGGAWKPITSNELYGRVRALAEVLAGWGVGKGDRVAIIAENRWEWPVTDFATLALGAVDVPLYPTLTPEQIGYMLRDTWSEGRRGLVRRAVREAEAGGELPALEHVVVMDAGTFEGAESFAG